MDASLIFLIAQFLTPNALGLDVVPFSGDVKTFEISHPIGVFLIRFEGNTLVVELPFRAIVNRVAADYLASIENALAQGIPLEKGGRLTFKLERHEYESFRKEDRTDFHSSVYSVAVEAPPVEVPAPESDTTVETA